MDIRKFLKEGDHSETGMCKDMSHNTGDIKEEPFDKMRMIRNKMVEARRLADKELHRSYKDKTERLGEEDVIYAKDVDNKQVQDHDEVVVVGADVVALYPNLTDLEVANICYEAVMKSKIAFKNINYRKALLY